MHIGSRYLARKAAAISDFRSIDLPPAFTPVISSTFLLKSMLMLFGFFSAGWAKFASFKFDPPLGSTNSKSALLAVKTRAQ